MTKNTSGIEAQMKSELSGKTGEEIISYAETIRKERAEREQTQALQEISNFYKSKKPQKVA